MSFMKIIGVDCFFLKEMGILQVIGFIEVHVTN